MDKKGRESGFQGHPGSCYRGQDVKRMRPQSREAAGKEGWMRDISKGTMTGHDGIMGPRVKEREESGMIGSG